MHLTLVFQHREESAPRYIGDALSKTVILLHTGNIQRFNCDGLVLAYNSIREFVQEIVALV
jgi:hypothetical protein